MNRQSPPSIPRRNFLKHGLALSSLGTASPLAMQFAAMNAAAATTSGDYKALVCVFLTGGNDSFNTLLATDSESWNAYNKVRSGVALPLESLLPLTPSTGLTPGRSIALHPQLGNLQRLFNTNRRLAVVSNVGPLLQPLTKSDYTEKSKPVPTKLFSHNDQQATWQSLAPEGTSFGWGGKLADALASGNGKSMFTGISTAGNAVWVSGRNVRQYQMTSAGALRIGVAGDSQGVDRVFGSTAAAAALQRLVQTPPMAHPLMQDVADVNKRSIAAEAELRTKLPTADSFPFGGSSAVTFTPPGSSVAQINPLALQLQTVARCMGSRNALGMTRQIFFVSLPGFDTHDDQLSRHARLMAQLDHALGYFDSVLEAMGLLDSVTTFTASDFGRTFTSNGDGTDHGWGAHHFVMGGAVRGGSVIGDFPVYSEKNANDNLFSSPDQLLNGSLLPRISVEQYGAALGQWFGAGSALNTVFPNLSRFDNLSLLT